MVDRQAYSTQYIGPCVCELAKRKPNGSRQTGRDGGVFDIESKLYVNLIMSSCYSIFDTLAGHLESSNSAGIPSHAILCNLREIFYVYNGRLIWERRGVPLKQS